MEGAKDVFVVSGGNYSQTSSTQQDIAGVEVQNEMGRSNKKFDQSVKNDNERESSEQVFTLPLECGKQGEVKQEESEELGAHGYEEITEEVSGEDNSQTTSTQQDIAGVGVQNEMERSNKKFDQSAKNDDEGESTEGVFTLPMEFGKQGEVKPEEYEELGACGYEEITEEGNGKYKLVPKYSNSTSPVEYDINQAVEDNEHVIDYYTEVLRLLECDVGKTMDILENNLLNEALEISKDTVDEEYLSFLKTNQKRMRQQISEFEEMKEIFMLKLSSAKVNQRELNEIKEALMESEIESVV